MNIDCAFAQDPAEGEAGQAQYRKLIETFHEPPKPHRHWGCCMSEGGEDIKACNKRGVMNYLSPILPKDFAEEPIFCTWLRIVSISIPGSSSNRIVDCTSIPLDHPQSALSQ
jgi:hypothetical protein